MVNKSFKDGKYWSDTWVGYIEKYLNAPPRCGLWLIHYFSDIKFTFLEIAGGSCRDSRFLFQKGRQSIGSDFDEKTLDYLKNKYSNSNFCLRKENAFKLVFDDNSIDIVFHNGFWVCFDDDYQIISLLKEQSRVANKYVVVLVHNLKNHKLVKRFKELSVKDNLYNFRFFDVGMLDSILKSSGLKYKEVRYEKFGGSVDFLFKFEKKIPILSSLIRWVVPRLYRYQPWNKVERIAMIIELDKSKI